MRKLLAAGAAFLWAASAHASDKPAIGPAPAWVKPTALPAVPPDKADGAPVNILLHDQQVFLERGRQTTYTRVAMRIGTPQGLAAGQINFPWRPEIDTATVHALLIRRGTQVIDVLGSGQTFTVVRREANLESATLDGVLTATLQPEGLQVGDVVDFALSISTTDPSRGGHVEQLGALWNVLPIRQAHLKVQWPSTLSVRWRQTSALPPIKRVDANGVSSFDLALADVQPLHLPEGAPARFRIGRLVEASDYRDWAELAASMAPLYATASALPAGGSLAAEAARIRALSPDPKTRAEAALALVQDRVRYVALEMGAGGLVPATAAETWARRYGDCKGKTALLLALLHALDIEAEPVLVSTAFGDGLNERLPMIGLFNHVLVRASVGGRSYWLDGTRTGDKRLDGLKVPAFGWGLPVRAGGSELLRMLPPPLAEPTQTTTIRIDASAGLTVPAPTRIEMLTRGDEALGFNLALANLAPEARERALRDYWREQYDFIDVKSTSANFDATRGEHRLVMEGTARMDWSGNQYETDGTGVGYKADFHRDPGPGSDAPFAVPYPVYTQLNETILLPKEVSGFKTSSGAEVDQTVAGIQYRRHAAISGNVFTVQRSERTVTPEFPAKDAPAAQAALRALAEKTVYLQAPAGYRPNNKEVAASLAVTPTTADGFVDRGNLFLDQGRYDEAIADFSKALALDPADNMALADRAMARVWKDDRDGAARDLDAATAIEPRNPVVFRARGLLAERGSAWADAVAAYTASLEIEPESSFALGRRAIAQRALGNSERALADAAAALKIEPTWTDLYLLRANLLRAAGRPEDAAAEAAALTAANPDNAYAHVVAGRIYGATKRPAQAMAAFDRALAIKPEDYIFLNRSEVRSREDVAGRRADIDAALRLSPKDPDALAAKAKLLAEAGDGAGAIRVWNAAVAADPQGADLLVGRGIAYMQAGNTALAQKDFAAARALPASGPEAANRLNSMCWAKATAGVALESALADCDAALSKAPGIAGFLDSRGLVLLRLGRIDEAIEAYNRALANRPTQPSSLYGRAAAWARKGDTARARADAEAALRINPDVRSEFEGYGIKL